MKKHLVWLTLQNCPHRGCLCEPWPSTNAFRAMLRYRRAEVRRQCVPQASWPSSPTAFAREIEGEHARIFCPLDRQGGADRVRFSFSSFRVQDLEFRVQDPWTRPWRNVMRHIQLAAWSRSAAVAHGSRLDVGQCSKWRLIFVRGFIHVEGQRVRAKRCIVFLCGDVILVAIQPSQGR